MAEGRYRVLWADAAAQDLVEIAEHLARGSPDGALRFLHRLESRGDSLRDMPDRGRWVPELADLGNRRWRELIEWPFRIVYRVAGRTVRVVAVVDGRRSVRDLLLARTLR